MYCIRPTVDSGIRRTANANPTSGSAVRMPANTSNALVHAP